MSFPSRLAGALLVLGLASCASIQTSTNYDPNAVEHSGESAVVQSPMKPFNVSARCSWASRMGSVLLSSSASDVSSR